MAITRQVITSLQRDKPYPDAEAVATAPALQDGLKAIDETLRLRGLLLSQRF